MHHAAARLIFNRKRSDHITDAVISLLWFRIPECICYKVAVLTYKVLHGSAPRYLVPLVIRVADLPGRHAAVLLVPPAWWCPLSSFQPSAVGSFQWSVLGSGIIYQGKLQFSNRCRFSVCDSELSCFSFRFPFPN